MATQIDFAKMDTPENEILRTVGETTPHVNSIMGLLPRGLLDSPRMMIRAEEKEEPVKNNQGKPLNIQGLQKKIVKEVTSMKFSEKVISVLEPATNRAKAGNCSQLLEPHVAPPPIQGCYYKPTEGKTRRYKEGSRLWHPKTTPKLLGQSSMMREELVMLGKPRELRNCPSPKRMTTKQHTS